MPFGLKNAGATFQRFIDNIFRGTECIFAYLDDILVFSETEVQHYKDLDKVMQILADNDLKISLSKCEFATNIIDFLGYSVSNSGIKPTTEKLKQISDFPQPTDSKALRRFLGMIGFYRRVVPHFASIILPLTELLKQHPNEKSLKLPDDAQKAFEEIKSLLFSVTPLAHPPKNGTHYHLVTDASNFATGAALHYLDKDGTPVPIGFFSKKLSESERRLSTYDRELLAAYLATLHFRPLIEGRQITLFTDHKPLVSAFKSSSPAKSDV